MATTPVTPNALIFKTKNAFIWAFVIGIVVISVVKVIAKDHPIPGGLIASGLGVVAMWLYQADQRKIRPESEQSRLGDEVYYLGLLYTLTSLCAALVSLFLVFVGEQTLEQRTDEMIGSFGIALLTTMAGVVMRVNLQRDYTERPETIIRIPHPKDAGVEGATKIDGFTADLERYAYELRRQLLNSTNAFASHTNQAILQAKTIHRHMDDMMQAFHRGLEEKANAQLESLEAIYNDVAKKAEVAEQRTASQQAGIQDALEKLETQVRSMDESIERIRAGSRDTAGNLETVGLQAKEIARVFAEGGNTVAFGMRTLTEAVDSEGEYQEVRKQFAREMGEQLKRQSEDWARVQQKVGELLDDFTLSNQALSRLGQEAHRTNAELATLPDGVTRARQSIEQLADIAGARDALKGLESKTEKFTEQLAGIAATGARHEEALEGAIEKLQALAELAGQEFDGRAKLKEAAGEIAEVASAAGQHAEGLKGTEREIQQINSGLREVQSVLQGEIILFADVLKQAIAALDEAKAKDGDRRSIKNWIFRK